MNLGRGLRFVFDDPQWLVKLLLGSLLSLVPIVNFAATGYMFDVVRNVAAGRDTPLPEWDNFGDKLVRDLIGAVISILWSLPVLVFACPLTVVIGAGSANSPNGELSDAATIGVLCLTALMVLVSLVLTPLSLVAQARYAVSNEFGAALPGPVLQQVRANGGAWITVLVAAIGIAVAVSVGTVLLIVFTAGLAACLIFPLLFLFGFYYLLAQGHWMGQAYRMSGGSQALPPSMV